MSFGGHSLNLRTRRASRCKNGGMPGHKPIAILIAAIVLATDPSSGRTEALRITARPVALNARDRTVRTVGRLEYRGGLVLRARHRRFGGLSALHVSADGRRLLALSDVGRWVSARLSYDRAGRLIGLDRGRIGRLMRPGGGRTRWRQRDAETIAALSGGRFLVGFEGTPRIWIYPASRVPFASAPRRVRVPRGLRFAARNAGLEALTVLHDGRLFALAEDLEAPQPHGAMAHAAWVRSRRAWAALAYDRVGLYRPTGAATLPRGTRHAGSVVVLERGVSLFTGFRARLMLVRAKAIRPGAVIRPRHLATLASPLTVDNFEGIATRRGPKGETLVYLVSDDNFRKSQRTLLMMFVLR